MGLQWESVNRNYSPFDAEMRRRLWWKIRSLQYRCAEENGFDACVIECISDTSLPVGINDCDFDPRSVQIIVSATGPTDSTICQIWSAITAYTSQISQSARGNLQTEYQHLAWIQEKERHIKEIRRHIDLNFLRFFNESQPLERMTLIYANLGFVSFLMGFLDSSTNPKKGENAVNGISYFQRCHW